MPFPPPPRDPSPADDPLAPSRRGFLKIGLGFSAALACASLLPALTGCSPATNTPHAGLAFLRSEDVALFRTLLPAVVDDFVRLDPAQRDIRLRESVRNIDDSCAAMSGHARAELRKLLGLLASAPLRRVLAGVSTDWPEASPQAVRDFLARWRGSRFETLNAGGVVLVKLASVGYFLLPSAWPASGYPGPNPDVYRALHA